MQKEGISLFLLKLFFSQCRKISWRESFKVSKVFGHGEVLCRRRGYHYFPSEILFLTGEIFRGSIYSMFQKNSGMEKFFAEEGDITNFC